MQFNTLNLLICARGCQACRTVEAAEEEDDRHISITGASSTAGVVRRREVFVLYTLLRHHSTGLRDVLSDWLYRHSPFKAAPDILNASVRE